VPFGSVPERTFSMTFRGDLQGFTLAGSRPSWRLCVPCLSVKRPKMIKPPSRQAAKGELICRKNHKKTQKKPATSRLGGRMGPGPLGVFA
jgi:hypothetical protein